MTLVGIRKVQFERDGNKHNGVNLYFTYEQKGVEGVVTEKAYLSAEKIADTEIMLGIEYDITYNKYGKPQAVVPM